MKDDWNYLRKFREALKGPLDFLYRNFNIQWKKDEG